MGGPLASGCRCSQAVTGATRAAPARMIVTTIRATSTVAMLAIGGRASGVSWHCPTHSQGRAPGSLGPCGAPTNVASASDDAAVRAVGGADVGA